MKYEDYEANPSLTCPNCRWQGTAREAHHKHPGETVFELWCPQCEDWFVPVCYPYADDYVKKAAGGDPESQRLVAHWAEVKATWLKSPDDLPELADHQELSFRCLRSLVGVVVSLDDGTFVWKERWFSGDKKRYEDFSQLLKMKYGPRFKTISLQFDSCESEADFDGWK